MGPCGISPSFPGLSPAQRQVAHVLLTRPPLGSAPEGTVLARLACVRHAASVRPEPGSNSPKKKFDSALNDAITASGILLSFTPKDISKGSSTLRWGHPNHQTSIVNHLESPTFFSVERGTEGNTHLFPRQPVELECAAQE